MMLGTSILSLWNMQFENALKFAHWVTSIPFLILCFAIYYTLRSIHRLYLSPLRPIPGPWFAAISDLWLIFHVLRLRRCRAVHDLFREYGPIVRAAPNKVFFLDVQTMKHVYGASAKLSKSTFYKSLLTYENDQAMTILDHAPHAARRKGYANHYAPANLALFQPEMHEFTLELIHYLRTLGNGVAHDAIALISHLMIDVNCIHLLGCRVDSISKWAMTLGIPSAEVHTDPFSTAIHDFPKRGLLRSALPKWLWFLVSRIPVARWHQLCESDRYLGEFVTQQVQEELTRMRIGKVNLENDERVSLITRLLRYRINPPNGLMEVKDIASEASGHLIAGVDTTATTASYIFWELSKRKDVVAKLREELDAVMPDPSVLPDIQALNDLPYLSAFLKEGLRLYSAAPSPLERVVPELSDSSVPLTIMGHVLPPGTIVATQSWSSQRDTNVFQDPHTFNPSRWLQNVEISPITKSSAQFPVSTPQMSGSLTHLAAQAEKGGSHFDSMPRSNSSQSQLLEAMNARMLPFGVGTRVCGGQNLAQMMLRIAIAALVRNFDVVAPPETNENSMRIMDSFVIFPAAMQCKLIFVLREK